MRLTYLSEGTASKNDKTAIAVVLNANGAVLLGKAIKDDDRNDKWCFPAGGIKDLSVEEAAERECLEETGIECEAQGTIANLDGRIFVKCVARKEGPLNPNHEFSEIRWIRPEDALSLPDLFERNREIVERLAAWDEEEHA